MEAGAVDGARTLLPRVMRGCLTFGNSFSIARYTENLARILMMEGDQEGAAERSG
ncbi:hypothetical protein [Catellatospora vulcania]|uniref:hypothetical protein n=1 Tax=Catellatospora vulcania TaxID=1460450 RepID=UPI0018AF7A15|nr:hypothetical protein [Catellatospora vulcania]